MSESTEGAAGPEGDGSTGGADGPDGSGGSGRRRVRVRVTGTVQGVGFRPFIYRLAGERGLAGWVRNDARGVLLEVEGSTEAISDFLDRLPAESPALARIESVEPEDRAPEGGSGFEIVTSAGGAGPSAQVSPDTATCDDCLAELLDRDDRRFRYPFINCTNCGPRFTIIRGIPYDRPQTTMAGFAMCDLCRAEYEDPADRRFHAQPNACPACGPTAVLVDRDGRAAEPEWAAAAEDAVGAAAHGLAAGAIIAVKGLGGFHLACRADDESAVAALRARKYREDKPFALMVPDLGAARRLAHLGSEEVALLESRERPIVLAPRRPEAAVAPAVAPGHRDLGLMLPYSPLHHILLRDVGRPLVMTSGNVSEEPIAYGNEEALERLADIVDWFLLHDRPIETRTDDSVARVVTVAGRRQTLMLRRSRGYVPVAIELPAPAPRPVLACGGHLKNTFTLVREGRAWVGPHIGDLENLETLRSFEDGIDHMERLFEVTPAVIAHDMHPHYLSSGYAVDRAPSPPAGTEAADPEGGIDALRRVEVQHHFAHMAACLAEHDERGTAIAAIYDGTGYGLDGTVWGGEILVGDLTGFQRIAHLWPVRLPGGEAAIRQPWRMACAWLTELMGKPPDLPAGLDGRVEPTDWANVARLADRGLASPVTSSVGRLFDAVSALCGIRLVVSYEGQAAIELELAADDTEPDAYPLPVLDQDGPALLDARATVAAVVEDLEQGAQVGRVAARFHNGLAAGTVEACRAAAASHGAETVVLSGGVFQNVRLLEATAAGLAATGLRPLVPERLPPNDGGLSYGQAVAAIHRRE